MKLLPRTLNRRPPLFEIVLSDHHNPKVEQFRVTISYSPQIERSDLDTAAQQLADYVRQLPTAEEILVNIKAADNG